MGTLSNFVEIRKFLDKYRISRAAELTLSKTTILGFKSKEEYMQEELKAYSETFINTLSQLVERSVHYKRNTYGIVLEWLEMIKTLLDAQEGMLQIILKNAATHQDEETTWVLKFASYSILVLMERAKREINRQKGILRKRHSRAMEVRENIVFTLQNISYYLMIISLAAYNLQKGKEKATRVLNVIAESLYETRDYE